MGQSFSEMHILLLNSYRFAQQNGKTKGAGRSVRDVYRTRESVKRVLGKMRDEKKGSVPIRTLPDAANTWQVMRERKYLSQASPSDQVLIGWAEI